MSRMESPASRQLSSEVVLPIPCTTMVTVPASGSEHLMVSGMRSPFSCRRRMRNCPGFCLSAMRGASIVNCLILRPTLRASTILYIRDYSDLTRAETKLPPQTVGETGRKDDEQAQALANPSPSSRIIQQLGRAGV